MNVKAEQMQLENYQTNTEKETKFGSDSIADSNIEIRKINEWPPRSRLLR